MSSHTSLVRCTRLPVRESLISTNDLSLYKGSTAKPDSTKQDSTKKKEKIPEGEILLGGVPNPGSVWVQVVVVATRLAEQYQRTGPPGGPGVVEEAARQIREQQKRNNRKQDHTVGEWLKHVVNPKNWPRG